MELNLHFTGITPLLMHRPTLVDPLHEITQEYKSFTSKRKRTDDDIRTIYRLEWEAGLYHDPELGPYVPSANVLTCLQKAGGLTRQGSQVARAVGILLDKLPLAYKGPRGNNGKGTQEIYDANLKDIRAVKNSGQSAGSVMRCRPMFPSWELSVPVFLEESLLDKRDLLTIAEKAGKMIGLGDGRKINMGRFEVAG